MTLAGMLGNEPAQLSKTALTGLAEGVLLEVLAIALLAITIIMSMYSIMDSLQGKGDSVACFFSGFLFTFLMTAGIALTPKEAGPWAGVISGTIGYFISDNFEPKTAKSCGVY